MIEPTYSPADDVSLDLELQAIERDCRREAAQNGAPYWHEEPPKQKIEVRKRQQVTKYVLWDDYVTHVNYLRRQVRQKRLYAYLFAFGFVAASAIAFDLLGRMAR